MKLLAKIGLFGLLAGGTASALYADPVGGWLSPNGVSGGGGSIGSTGSTGNAGMTLPLIEMQMRVQTMHEQTRADARHIQHLQQVARKDKDVLKLNCVNDKLVQVKPQMNIADASEAEIESSNDASRGAAFEQISLAADSVRRLREEADQCIGSPVQSGGESSNSYSGPHVPDDPYRGFGNSRIEAPGYASPFN